MCECEREEEQDCARACACECECLCVRVRMRVWHVCAGGERGSTGADDGVAGPDLVRELQQRAVLQSKR